jgi:threonine aldolase
VLTTPDDAPSPDRSLHLHGPHRRRPDAVLSHLADRATPDGTVDAYGRDGAVRRLEQRVADLLGKERALLFPTGTMAQQVALRVHADAAAPRLGPASRTVAFHPRCHLEAHEDRGYAHVHGLTSYLLCDPDRLVRLSDITAIPHPVSAVLLELPQRDLGGILPVWDDLVAQTAAIRAHGAAAHLDGARLWEAQPFYDRPHAEIAAQFDTVYVSLYKGLEGLSGAVLAGDDATMAAASTWRLRLGGRPHTSWPVALSAEAGLDLLLPRMRAFWERARELAAALVDVPGVEVLPDPPQTPLFHVLVDVPETALAAAADEQLRATGVQVVLYTRATTSPRRSRFELVVGENAMEFTVAETRELLADLVERARRLAGS